MQFMINGQQSGQLMTLMAFSVPDTKLGPRLKEFPQGFELSGKGKLCHPNNGAQLMSSNHD